MKTWNLCGALFKYVAGVLLVMLAAAAVAAPTVGADEQLASLANRAELGAAPATVASPFTLHVEDASGHAFRLERVDGSGWKLANDARTPVPDAKSLHEVSFEPSKLERPREAMMTFDEPLTVFIDGASGFTYVYNRDGGWRFVGKLVDRRD